MLLQLLVQLTPVALVCLVVLAVLQLNQRAKCKCRALLVVAHPDDESFFFANFMHGALGAGCELHVLCLSTGDAAGLGKYRRDELLNACTRVLQIPDDRVAVVNDPMLQDGFHEWDTGSVGTHIIDGIRASRPDMLVTFDSQGVSRHPNHTSVYKAVRELLRTYGREDGGALGENSCTVYTLLTVPLLRKYSGPLDAIAALLSVRRGDLVFVARSPLLSARLLLCHWTQLVWYRVLFVLFSSYTYINTLRPIGKMNINAIGSRRR